MPIAYRNQFATAFTILCFATASGCSDNPVDADDDGHSEAVVLALHSEGSVLYAYDSTDGAVTCDAPPCDLEVMAGGPPLRMEIVLYDPDGGRIDVSTVGEEFVLRATVADENTATASIGFEQGLPTLQLQGVAPGSTQLRVTLRHGDEHDDLGTPPLGTDGAIVVNVGMQQ